MDLELIPTLIILSRILVPFVILRFPLTGALLAILADSLDVIILDLFNTTFHPSAPYHFFDKIFDIWYLFFEFLLVLKWKDKIARNTAAGLFIWRAIGFLAFIIFGYREAFFFAPNIFEFFFLACLIIWKYNSNFKFTWKSTTIVLLIVGIPNIIKEYIMHFKYPGQTWSFFKENLFFWLYN